MLNEEGTESLLNTIESLSNIVEQLQKDVIALNKRLRALENDEDIRLAARKARYEQTLRDDE